MERKRPHPADDLDPDYEDVADQQNKRQRQVEHDAKLVTTKKIEAIIRQQFAQELQYKETEVDIIDQRLYKARQKLDRLRACLVGSYYSTVTQATGQKKPGQEPSLSIHPAVKQHLGKAPLGVISDSDTGHDLAATPPTATDVRALPGIREEKGAAGTNRKEQQDISVLQKPKSMTPNVTQSMGHGGRGHFKEKRRIIIGNVSRYILTEKRDAGDRATHKWMVYVRGSKEHPNISSFIKKAWFFLHPSYSPNDLVEVSQEPFHLIRRGWGEFPIRVQLHFVDPRNKRVDVIHHLKLDKTYTGLQTLGAETVVDLELEGEREYSTQSSSGRFPIAGSRQTPAATEAPPMTVKKTKSEVLPSSDHNGKLVAACDISVKKELSDSDMDRVSGSDASSDLSQTSKSSNPSELLKMASSYLVKVKSEPMSPVKDNAQRNGFIASVCSSGSTSTHAMSPNARVEANDLTSCHETPAMPSHGGTVPAKFHANSDTSVLQSIKMEPEDEALLTNPESHTATVVVCATPSLSPPTTRSGTIDISPSATRSGTIGISPSATKSGTIGISSPTTMSSTPSISPPTTRCDTPGQSVQVMNDSSVDSETNDCLPHVEPPDVSSYDAPSVGDASLTMIDASLIKSEQTPVDVSLSQNAVGSSQSPGQSLLRPQLLPGRTALPEQLFMRVVDQTGRTYLIPGSVAGAAGVGSGGNQKVKDTGKVVFVKKSSTRLPIVVTPSSRPKPMSIASPRQLDGHPVVMETPSGNKAAATSVLPPSVSSLLHSYSRLTQKANLPASRSGGAVSLLRPRIPTAAGGVPCTTYQKLANIPLGTVVPSSDITASSASKPRFVTFASTTKQTVVMPQGHTTRAQTAVVTPGVPTAKLYLAKVGNKTVMIRVEPKCKTTKPIDAPRPPGGQCNRCSDGAPHPAKEAAGTKHLSDGKGSAEEAGRATSDRIARFVQGISVADYSCIEELVGAALGHFPPLWIQPLTGVTQSVNQGVRPDIMRSSCSDVLQWNIGKQRATEWLHARLIQRAVKVALDGQTEFKGEMLWTTRQVMMWCRYHGYTPLDIATQRTLQRVSHRHVGPRKFDSYTDCKDLVPLIEGALHSASVEEPDVDVDTVEVNTGKSASHAPSITGVVSSEMVAPSAEVKFIQQMAQQIGVHFGPVELTLEPPQCMYAGVTEILMWTAAMTFTEHLLRAAVCSYYKREPQGDTEVAAVDVYDALTRTECFDFLTNRYMAVMSEDQSLTTTQSCGTAVTLDMT